MMLYPKRYLITAALPYANGPLHIGHLAGAYLSADIYTRYLKLMGKDAVFICGSDEHGAAITMRAQKEGTTPQNIIDKYHAQFKATFEGMGIDFDYYDRTSSPEHHETAAAFFKQLYDQGVFEEKVTEQYYDTEAKQFLADRYISGTCPKCGFQEAYGDQCENCGATLSPTELENPKSTLSGSRPELRETRHWFLPLQNYESFLKEWLEEGTLKGKPHHDPESWKPHVLGQCKSWIDGGLQARAMTRDLDWGVDVPQEIPGSEGKKLYVWLDAPIGYISATQKWAENNKTDWKSYWQSDDSALIHFIGKDNIVFHCIIFPALLQAHGDFNLPVNVPANQFMNLEDKKISTSRNWAVWVGEYLEEFPGKADELRYALSRIMPESRDSEFTWKRFQDFNNNELVNSLGNFIQRVLVLTNKYYDGKVPDFDPDQEFIGASDPDDDSFHDSEMLDLFDLLHDYGTHMRAHEFRAGLQRVMDISASGNQLLQFNEPWKIAKEDPERVKVIMNAALQIVAALSVAMAPFLPFTSAKLRSLLNLQSDDSTGDLLELMNQLAEGEEILKPGHDIEKPKHLFSRIDDQKIQEQIDRLSASEQAAIESASDLEPIREAVDFQDFQKLDLRTAVIKAAQKVPKTKKLLEIQVDMGLEERTVVSGIAEFYDPANLVGQQVVLVANLAPRKIKGITSEGMILMSEDPSGKLHFVGANSEAHAGSRVK